MNSEEKNRDVRALTPTTSAGNATSWVTGLVRARGVDRDAMLAVAIMTENTEDAGVTREADRPGIAVRTVVIAVTAVAAMNTDPKNCVKACASFAKSVAI